MSNFKFLFLSFFFFLTSHLISQSISYELLGEAPIVDIERVYMSPNGDTYLRSRTKLSISRDNGQTWDEIENLPSGFRASDIGFMKDGSAILIDLTSQWNRNWAIIFRDGSWQDLMGDLSIHISSSIKPYAIYENSLFYQRNDTLIKTIDKGLTNSVEKKVVQGGRLIRMMAADDKIYLFKSILDTIDNKTDYLIDSYDHNLNFLNRNFTQIGFISAWGINNLDSNIVVINHQSDRAFLSQDGGLTFINRSIQDLNNIQWGLAQNKLFYTQNERILSIPLDDNFGSAVPQEEDFGDFKFLYSQNDYLIGSGMFEYSVKDLKEDEIFTITEFPFSDVILYDMKINKQGDIFITTLWNDRIYKSIDDGQTWERMPGSDFIHLLDDGGYVTATSADSNAKIITVNNEGQIIRDWSINVGLPQDGYDGAISFNNGEYRFAFVNVSCTDVGWKMFVSRDFEPFREYWRSPSVCPLHRKATLFNDKIYLTGLFGIYTSIDLHNDYKFERKELTVAQSDSTNYVKYSGEVTESGQLYIYANRIYSDSLVNTPVFEPTYYSEDVRNEYELSGQGPQGTLLVNDKIEGSFIINGIRHFYRKDVLDDYIEIPVIDSPFSEIRTGDIDNKGRIIVLSIGGKLYRTNEIDLTTSTQDQITTGLKIYPNPVQDILSVNFDQPSKGTYRILDFNGQSILSSAFSKSNLEITTSGITEGIYILEITKEDGERHVQKFIKH